MLALRYTDNAAQSVYRPLLKAANEWGRTVLFSQSYTFLSVSVPIFLGIYATVRLGGSLEFSKGANSGLASGVLMLGAQARLAGAPHDMLA
jgi:hypothetical protein